MSESRAGAVPGRPVCVRITPAARGRALANGSLSAPTPPLAGAGYGAGFEVDFRRSPRDSSGAIGQRKDGGTCHRSHIPRSPVRSRGAATSVFRRSHGSWFAEPPWAFEDAPWVASTATGPAAIRVCHATPFPPAHHRSVVQRSGDQQRGGTRGLISDLPLA